MGVTSGDFSPLPERFLSAYPPLIFATSRTRDSYSRDLTPRNSPPPATPVPRCVHACVPAIPVKGARCNFEGKSGFGGRAEARSHRLSSVHIFSWLWLVNILSSPAETSARCFFLRFSPLFRLAFLPRSSLDHPSCATRRPLLPQRQNCTRLRAF